MSANKIIINIGRQIGSGGHILATQLADDLGYKLYDKELLNLAAKESGFSERFFEENDEQKGFLQSLAHLNVNIFGENSFYKNDFSQESLYQFQSQAICKAAEEGNCIFVGRTADYVLRNYPNVVNVFITANLDERIKRVAERRKISEEAARKFIADKEAARATYYNYYTGKEWGAAKSYDITINSSLLGLKATEAFLANIIRQREALCK